MALPSALFVTTTVHARKVRLGDGQDHTLHFKELPHKEVRRFFDAQKSEDEDVRHASIGRLIAASLCDPDGTLAITPEQAVMLRDDAAIACAAAVLEVSGRGDKKGNASPPEASSGSGTS